MTDDPNSTGDRNQPRPTPDNEPGDSGTKSTVPTPGFPGTDESIGDYEILEKLGEGAFGEVFRARQTAPIQRTVALKVLRAGLDSKEVFARFNAERQALALMNHPSITAVFDAGTTKEGRPFIAMEFIRGEPITRFCDEARLDLEQRLELFDQLCSAVQHAHHKGVIHRDLKPSNVLVAKKDGKPLVKIIDFGIAKALGAGVWGHETLTLAGQIVGTRLYMSPEQACGDSQLLDTRTDIYSLGVLLYELISGELPHDENQFKQAGLDGWRRLLLEKDPLRPSQRFNSTDPSTRPHTTDIAAKRRSTPRTLMRRLNEDLDWVVMRCLEKECARRYPTVSELAADIRRFLANEPVLAGPPTLLYRLRKLIRRRRGMLLASAAVAVTALVGVAVATALILKNQEQSRKNQEQAHLIAATRARALLQEARREAWFTKEAAAELLAQAQVLAPGDLNIERELALLPATNGKRDDAITQLRRFLQANPRDSEALSFLAGLLAEDAPKEAEALRRRAEAGSSAAQALFAEGLATADNTRAINLFTQSLKLYDWNFDAVWQRGVRRYLTEDYPRALEDAELLVRLEPRSPLALSLRGSVLAKMNRLDEAARDFTLAANTPDPRWQLLSNRCWINLKRGEYTLALEDAKRLEQIEGLDCDAREVIGWSYLRTGAPDTSMAVFTRAIEHGCPGKAMRYGRGTAAMNSGRWTQAIADFDQVISENPQDADARLKRAEAYMQNRQFAQAIDEARAAQALAPENALVRATLGRALQKAGKPVEAASALSSAVALEPSNKIYWAELGANYWMNGRNAEALRALRRSLGSKDTVWVRVWIWDLLTQSGHEQEASEVMKAATGELDTPLMNAAVELLLGGELPPKAPAFVTTPYDQLYWHLALASAALARGDRQRAKREYEEIVALDTLTDTERDIAAWRLGKL